MRVCVTGRSVLIGLVCIVAYAAWCVWDPSLPFLYESGVGKKAIVVGATAGMGREAAKLLMMDGYVVGCVGRRQGRLDELRQAYGQRCVPCVVDVSADDATENLQALIGDMGGCDIMMISVSCVADKWAVQKGGAVKNRNADEWPMLNVDLLGFVRAAHAALDHFEVVGAGHLVGVSSVSGLVGEAGSPAYSGAKAFMQRYMQGVRNRMIQRGLPIYVTDIIPGYVDTDWIEPGEWNGEYWSCDVQTAGRQIFAAIKARKKVAYITKRWRLISWLYAICPDWLYNVIGGF